MLAIIPARGGSKRLPGKNIKDFCGKPLLAYTIECALKCDSITRIIVSTDDEDIATTARDCGAEVPGLRPAKLAGDTVGTWDVILWHLDQLKNEQEGKGIPEVAVLQATSPLRNSLHLEEAIQKFRRTNADTLISVSAQSHRPEWSFYQDQETLKPYFPLECSAYPDPRTEHFTSSASDTSATTKSSNEIGSRIPRDKIPLMPNGAIFLLRTQALRQNKSHINSKMTPYIMPAMLSVDIDTQEDWELAEMIYQSHETETD